MLALLILAGAAHADEFKMFLLAEDLGGLVHCREGAGSTCSSFQFLLCPAQEIFASSLQVRRVPARSHKYPWHNLRDYCTYCSRASRQPGNLGPPPTGISLEESAALLSQTASFALHQNLAPASPLTAHTHPAAPCKPEPRYGDVG